MRACMHAQHRTGIALADAPCPPSRRQTPPPHGSAGPRVTRACALLWCFSETSIPIGSILGLDATLELSRHDVIAELTRQFRHNPADPLRHLLQEHVDKVTAAAQGATHCTAQHSTALRRCCRKAAWARVALTRVEPRGRTPPTFHNHQVPFTASWVVIGLITGLCDKGTLFDSPGLIAHDSSKHPAHTVHTMLLHLACVVGDAAGVAWLLLLALFRPVQDFRLKAPKERLSSWLFSWLFKLPFGWSTLTCFTPLCVLYNCELWPIIALGALTRGTEARAWVDRFAWVLPRRCGGLRRSGCCGDRGRGCRGAPGGWSRVPGGGCGRRRARSAVGSGQGSAASAAAVRVACQRRSRQRSSHQGRWRIRKGGWAAHPLTPAQQQSSGSSSASPTAATARQRTTGGTGSTTCCSRRGRRWSRAPPCSPRARRPRPAAHTHCAPPCTRQSQQRWCRRYSRSRRSAASASLAPPANLGWRRCGRRRTPASCSRCWADSSWRGSWVGTGPGGGARCGPLCWSTAQLRSARCARRRCCRCVRRLRSSRHLWRCRGGCGVHWCSSRPHCAPRSAAAAAAAAEGAARPARHQVCSAAPMISGGQSSSVTRSSRAGGSSSSSRCPRHRRRRSRSRAGDKISDCQMAAAGASTCGPSPLAVQPAVKAARNAQVQHNQHPHQRASSTQQPSQHQPQVSRRSGCRQSQSNGAPAASPQANHHCQCSSRCISRHRMRHPISVTSLNSRRSAHNQLCRRHHSSHPQLPASSLEQHLSRHPLHPQLWPRCHHSSSSSSSSRSSSPRLSPTATACRTLQLLEGCRGWQQRCMQKRGAGS